MLGKKSWRRDIAEIIFTCLGQVTHREMCNAGLDEYVMCREIYIGDLDKYFMYLLENILLPPVSCCGELTETNLEEQKLFHCFT